MSTCDGDFGRCEHRAMRKGLCWGHLKRQQRRLDIHVPLAEKPGRKRARNARFEAVRKASLALADAELETKKDQRRAESRLMVAAWRWGLPLFLRRLGVKTLAEAREKLAR